MADAPGFEVRTNLPDFKKQLAGFSFALERKIVRTALKVSAEVLRQAVIHDAPELKHSHKGRSPGLLRRSIYIYPKRSPKGIVTFIISFLKRGKDAPFYGRFLERGWMPRGPGKKLQGGTRFRRLQRERNRLAGHKRVEYPFIGRAFKRASGAALDAFNTSMQQQIDKASKQK